MTPFAVLGVAADADDETIKKAYLDQVRLHPPERDPAAFQRVREAFEAVRDRRARLQHRLFRQQPPSIDELVEPALRSGRPRRPEGELFARVLRSGQRRQR